MHADLYMTLTLGELAATDGPALRVQRNTRGQEPEWPEHIACPDGCGATVWVVGDEHGKRVLLDTLPVAPGQGGYVVEPLYVGPKAEGIIVTKSEQNEATSGEYVEVAGAWNWYGMYESTLITSNNTRFGLHVRTCARKTEKQRARATNGQTYGGCCRARRLLPRTAAVAGADRRWPSCGRIEQVHPSC